MHVVLTDELIPNSVTISKFKRRVYVLDLAKCIFILDIVAGYDSYVDVYCPELLLTCCDICNTCVFIVGTGYMKMH